MCECTLKTLSTHKPLMVIPTCYKKSAGKIITGTRTILRQLLLTANKRKNRSNGCREKYLIR